MSNLDTLFEGNLFPTLVRLHTLGDDGIELWLSEERPGTNWLLKVGGYGCLDVDV